MPLTKGSLVLCKQDDFCTVVKSYPCEVNTPELERQTIRSSERMNNGLHCLHLHQLSLLHLQLANVFKNTIDCCAFILKRLISWRPFILQAITSLPVSSCHGNML